MAETLTISISHQDKTDLDQNPSWSPSKIFRAAMKLQRKLEAFDCYCLEDYLVKLLDTRDKFTFFQNEILKREEKIDSLKNVLEEKIVAERRLRETKQSDHRSGQGSSEIENLRREYGEQPEELAWPRKPQAEW